MEEYNLEIYPIENNTEDKIEVQIEANLKLVAPVAKNTKIGEVTISYDNHIILKIDILTAETIRKKGIVDYIFEMSKNYSGYLEEVM